jgi:glycosyl hydrolase family 10
MRKLKKFGALAISAIIGVSCMGADIGIYNAALGGGKSAGPRAIKTTLDESKMSVEEFSKMSIENLLKYRVVIIPNTRKLSKDEDARWRDNLRAYVADCGGALVFFHDAVGAKRSPFGMLPLFPEIADLRTVERVESKEVQVAIDPLLADFQYLPNYGIKQTVKHMYDDHFTFICLNGKTLLSDIKTKKAVVAVGEVGKGRVVLDGMWGGKTTGQAGILEGIDKDVFINTVKWCLAGKGLTETDAAKVKVKEWKPDVKGSSKSSNKVAVIYGENYEGSAEIAKEKITNSGIDYDFIPMHFLPIRGLDKKEYKLIIAFLQSGKSKASKESFEKINSYIENGGKAIIFLPRYSRKNNNGGKILKMLGCKQGDVFRNNIKELRKIVFTETGHKPAKIENSVMGISSISEPTKDGAKTIAYWHNNKGEKKYPAVIKAKFGYVVNNNTYGDPCNNDMFIANSVIEFVPEIKEKVFENLTKKYNIQKELIGVNKLSQSGNKFLLQADKLLKDAEKAAKSGNYTEANSSILKGKDFLVKAFSVSMPSVKGEERMVFAVARELDPDTTCKRLAKAGFTGISIIHLEGHFPSELYERKDDGKIDWLQKWVDSAHKHGLKIGPSFGTFSVYKGSKEFEQGVKEDWRVVPAHSYGKEPKPYKKNMYKIGFCRSHSEVSDYAIKKSLEIIKKYQVDYVFYDGIRWTDTCYCDHCRKGFEKDTGLKINKWPDDALDKYQNEYNDWRAKHITKVIREASKNIAKINPKVKLGVYTFRGKYSSWAKGQYWWEWGNYVDYIMPMYYNPDNQFMKKLCQEINGLIPAGSKAKLVPCLAPSGYRTTSQFIMLQQIALQQKYGPTGIMYFRYLYLSDSNLELLKMGPFRNK